jgi:glycosyltransferase involved in cell wall biosynthesis/N-acetylmuramoyl-L-alanine amidase
VTASVRPGESIGRASVFVAAGHGADDPGAEVAGLVERDLNAAVTAVLVERLRDHGLAVATDLEHGNPTFPDEADLARRIGVAYYVVVHHNAHDSEARGVETFGRSGSGAPLARSLLDEIVSALRTIDPTLPDRGVRDDAGTGAAKHLDLAPGRSVVVELCFLSSAADRAIIDHAGYAGLAAEAMCRAIVDHGRVDGSWSAVYDRAGPTLAPLVSVVVPSANRPLLLAEAVASILGQTVTDLEVLVVDDGTHDPVVDPLGDERVRVLRTGGGRGPAVARNVGIEAARGQILAFLDDDDRWTPGRLDLALQGLRRAPVAVCATQHMGRPAAPPRRLEGRVGDAVLRDTTPCLGATAVRREVAPAFDERWQAVEDVVWWWELARRADIATEDGVGYLVRLHDGPRGTNTVARRVDENLRLLDELADVFDADPVAAAHRWLRVGVLAEQAGARGVAVRAYAHHLRLRPRPGAVAHVALALGRWLVPRRPAPDPAPSAPDRDDPRLRTTHLLMSDRARGAERAARHLADALDGLDGLDGLEPTRGTQRVVALAPSDGSGGRVRLDGSLLRSPGAHLLRRRVVPAALRLRREVRRHPTDVVLAHGSGPALVASLASLLGPFPPFVWHRILVFPPRPRWHPVQLAFRLVARRASGVVALTEATHQEVRAMGFHGPVWTVPNHRPAAPYADLDRRRAADRLRDELGIDRMAPVVGFVGHLVVHKRPDLAVDAFALVRRAVPGARLVMVGDGDQMTAVRRRVAEIAPDVHLLGHREDIPRLLAGFDVLMATSHHDSMPGTVVEAQLAGTPVVAFAVDGIGQALTLGVSGVATATRSVEELAAEVAALLADNGRRRAMSSAARTHGAGLTTDAVAPRYAALLDAVAGTAAVRVLHLLPDFGTGGAERALAVLANGLDRREVVQTVITVRGDRRPRNETVAPELDALGVGRGDLGVAARPTRSPAASLVAALRLARVARRWRADVVDAALLDATLVSRLAPLRAARVGHLVNTPWEPVVTRTSGGRPWRARSLRLVDRWSSRRDDALVALTDAVAAAARRDLGPQVSAKLQVIPRGVDLDRFPALTPAPTSPQLRLVSVGRLVPQKGHDTVVQALARLRARGVPASLTIVGEGPEHESLTALVADAGLDGSVTMTGARTDVAELLAACDVFVLASRWEGQSNAVLEAMASARPVVVGDVPALREVVGDAGVLVAPDDVTAWVDALATLAADPARRQALALAGRRRVEERYDARTRASQLGTLYQRLAAGRSRAQPPTSHQGRSHATSTGEMSGGGPRS